MQRIAQHIALCAQNTYTILGSTVNTLGKAYTIISKNKTKFISLSITFAYDL